MRYRIFYLIVFSTILFACNNQSQYKAGDTVEHSSGFAFEIPQNMPNIEVYEYGIYSHDRNIILRIFTIDNASTRLNITLWQFPLDNLDRKKGARLFGRTFSEFVDGSEEYRENNFDSIKIDKAPAFGKNSTHIQASDIYLIFLQTESDLYVLQYSTSIGDFESHRNLFDDFVTSIKFSS